MYSNQKGNVMRVVRIWVTGEDAVNILTDISTKDIEDAVKKHRYDLTDEMTESTLEVFLFEYFPGSVTIIPREVDEIEFLLG